MSNGLVKFHIDAIVRFQGEDWRIMHVPDFNRVLAKRLSDGHLDFLPTAELAGGPPSLLPGQDGGAEMSESSEVEASPAARYGLAKRVPRPTRQGSTADEKNLEQLVAQFKELVDIVRVPNRKRGAKVKAFADQHGITLPTAYRRLAIVEATPTVDALNRAVRSDKGKPRLNVAVAAIIREKLQKHRRIPEAKTLERVRDLVNGVCRSRDLPEVSIETIRRFEQEIPLKQRLEEMGRLEEAKALYGNKVGHLPGNDYPLALVQIDHTPCQICFVDEIDRMPIGDAWLTHVIDTYSRMILGFFLSFDAPSALSAGMALAQAILPKESLLRRLGIEGEWPCWGYPDIVHVDNAQDLNGRMMHSAREQFRFDLIDRPVGSPNFGGTVESAFRTFINRHKETPGTKFSNIFERAEYDSEGRAIMTLREFEVLYIEFLVNDYHLKGHRGHDMDLMAPLQKWKLGIFEGDKRPPRGLPDRPTDELSIKLGFLPYEMRTIQDGTVSMFAEKYYSGVLQQVMLDIDPNAPKDKRRFMVRYDPRDISRVWLFREKTQSYIELTFADARKPAITLWEHNARKKRRGDPAREFVEQRFQSIQKQDELRVMSAKATKKARKERQRETERKRGALTSQERPPRPKSPQYDDDLIISDNDAEELKRLSERVRPASVKGHGGNTNDGN
ncbi:MAG: hypothetical protein CVV05_12945 [Gammaproteobacteria bacterium HGW-Gammaproteobacteria-1]|nr:MAG: hypothetical protein CVV05_12945 [Gammaproteobacteria bacterium HGW-Gammaproteobacteria-1]